MSKTQTTVAHIQSQIDQLYLALYAAANPDERRDIVYAKYHATVNMGAVELERWSQTDASKRASLNRSPIQRNLELLRTAKADWSAKHVAWANRTISFVSRMRRVSSGRPVNQDIGYSKRDISLKNWAFDPKK